jgi:hypothetical protein
VAAQAALMRCDQVDECQEWANKAAALASYARQARDKTLLDMATRIQARAVRRSGELLKAIPAGRGNTGQRMAVARAAGFTRQKYCEATAVAQIPREKFEELVEAPNPPKTYVLHKIGNRPRDKRSPKDLRRALAQAEVKVARLTTRLNAAKKIVETLRERIAETENNK